MRRYLAELIGTFCLVFCGTGAIIINELTQGAVTHAGIAITFGLIVAAMIYALGEISHAHINPAVTLSMAVSGHLQRKDVLPYISSQIVGALFASITLKALFAKSVLLGTTLPSGGVMQSFILELILTFILMLVILLVANSKNKQFTGLIVGGVVLLEAMFAGPISGASMNPARSIAPAIISSHIEHLWLYIAAPIIGALLATGAYKLITIQPDIKTIQL
ncbi:MIP/aquaporin family protein [Solitalea lacus]|uniref:MIP/aquaporin family protein n=1 Tax=Solitalea lacus TaxID=2911172 RepID=UPI001EDADA89|nr:aquaporin [Solitalea lacus]UKJ07641.1 aquaporin [Solitalea lacus]